MGFVDLESMQPIEPVQGCRLRTPYGEHLMLSYLQMDADAEIPMHQHPHEQAGILLSGKLRLTIGDETRVVEPGSLFIIPPKVNGSRDRGLHEAAVRQFGSWREASAAVEINFANVTHRKPKNLDREAMLLWLRNRQSAGQGVIWTDVCLENRDYALAIRREFGSRAKAFAAALSPPDAGGG